MTNFRIIFFCSLFFLFSCNDSSLSQDENIFFSKTNFYKLKIKNHNLNYDHIAIYQENKNQIIAYAVRGFGEPQAYTSIELDKVTINLDANEIEAMNILTIEKNIRVTDILIDHNKNIFIAYVTKNDDFKFFLTIVKLEKNKALKKIFTTLPIHSPLSIVESGGKMIEFNNDYLLLSVGDFGQKDSVQKKDNQLGKIIKVNKISRENEIYSIGHRNPQGLTNFEKKVIFSTLIRKIMVGQLRHMVWIIILSSAMKVYIKIKLVKIISLNRFLLSCLILE